MAEGFGLTLDEFRDMMRAAMKGALLLTDTRMEQVASEVFAVLDDDCNDLVDALEFLGSVAVLSGMSTDEKVRIGGL